MGLLQQQIVVEAFVWVFARASLVCIGQHDTPWRLDRISYAQGELEDT